MINISESTIIVCGIVRNAEKGLKKNIPGLVRFCSLFKDYRVFVYENDSTDSSKTLLTELAASAPNNVFISLNTTDKANVIPSKKDVGQVNPYFSAARINKMARLRNHYMEYIDNQGWNADYLMVVDLDVSAIVWSNVLSCFSSNINWDAVTAFGYSLAPSLRERYHDTYALTEYQDDLSPQSEEKIYSLGLIYGKLKETKNWIRVFSAFGGLAIYRFDAVKGCRYSALPNDDPKVEVHCEHYSIYRQMAERGYNKVYINPSMLLKYQDLTWNIIINSIKRKFGL